MSEFEMTDKAKEIIEGMGNSKLGKAFKEVMRDKELKVFRMNDYDWWADYSPEEAEKNYIAFVASQCDEFEATGGAVLLSDQDLLEHTYRHDDGGTGSFKTQLSKLDKPQIFASTEY